MAEPNKKPYKLLTGSHVRTEDGIKVYYISRLKGRNVIYLSDIEAAQLGKRVELLPTPAAVKQELQPEEPKPVPETPTINYTSMSAQKLIPYIQSCTNKDEIERIYTAEKERVTPRKPVLSAAEKRYQELGGDVEE